MEIKKYPSKDVRTKRFDFTLIGLAFVLFMVLMAFEWTTKPKKDNSLNDVIYEEEMVVMENTIQQKKPPPPPPPPELQVVEDDVEIEDQIEFDDTESDQDDVTDDYSDDDDDEPPVTDEVFEMYAVQEQAEFRGGMLAFQKFIKENLEYPEAAKAADVQGMVMVRFVVDKKGNISKLEILTPPKGFGLEDEAMRVVKLSSGNWKPAKQRDQPVNVRFQIPINFQLY